MRDTETPAVVGALLRHRQTSAAVYRRDGDIKYKLADLEQDRRSEIDWYGNWGQAVLERYEEWRDSIAPKMKVEV